MTKLAIAFALSLLMVSPALAIKRVNTNAHSCHAVQDIVQRDGAAILRYPGRNPKNTLYDRYVANRHFCGAYEVTQHSTVLTKDRCACPVLKCRDFDPDIDRIFSVGPAVRVFDRADWTAATRCHYNIVLDCIHSGW